MTSDLEKLADAARHLAAEAKPLGDAARSAQRMTKGLQSGVPEGREKAALLAALDGASRSAAKAADEVAAFASGAARFADRLARGSRGGSASHKSAAATFPSLAKGAVVTLEVLFAAHGGAMDLANLGNAFSLNRPGGDTNAVQMIDRHDHDNQDFIGERAVEDSNKRLWAKFEGDE